jgi:hypothetical protein
MHFYFPIISQFLRCFGCFEGTAENTTRLMLDGQPILVFPGGGREACRRTTDPKYSLFWGNRTGFARLAIQYGYTIVCLASVGVEEQIRVCYDIPVWPILFLAGDKRARENFTFPLVYPLSLLPQRIYIHSGREAIETSKYRRDTSERNQHETRDQAMSLLLEAIADARNEQRRHGDC